MASEPFDVLSDPLEWLNSSADVDPDTAIEIGADDNRALGTVSRVDFHDRELVFADEIPVTRYVQWRELADAAKTFHEWCRMEYKTYSNPQAITSGDTLVATCWPRGNGWVYVTRFRPGWKGQRSEQPQPDSKVQTFPQLLQWLEAQPHDYWDAYSYAS